MASSSRRWVARRGHDGQQVPASTWSPASTRVGRRHRPGACTGCSSFMASSVSSSVAGGDPLADGRRRPGRPCRASAAISEPARALGYRQREPRQLGQGHRALGRVHIGHAADPWTRERRAGRRPRRARRVARPHDLTTGWSSAASTSSGQGRPRRYDGPLGQRHRRGRTGSRPRPRRRALVGDRLRAGTDVAPAGRQRPAVGADSARGGAGQRGGEARQPPSSICGRSGAKTSGCRSRNAGVGAAADRNSGCRSTRTSRSRLVTTPWICGAGQRAGQQPGRLAPGRRPGDHLGQHRVVVHADDRAVRDAGVEPDPGAGQRPNVPATSGTSNRCSVPVDGQPAVRRDPRRTAGPRWRARAAAAAR